VPAVSPLREVLEGARSGRVRLNLGAGDHPLEGWENLDRRSGQEIYPLDRADASVDEIRASHVLEHFSHRETLDVLRDWVRVLRPAGRLRLAVPDFERIARDYLAGAAAPHEGYVMGGHVDANDHHGALFDAESLGALMREAGLLAVTRWTSDVEDCSGLAVSLNLQAYKPPASLPRISACMSVPRLGFMDNFFAATGALTPLRIPLRKHTGAFWGPCLTRCIEQALEEDAPEWILAIDYDSIYGRDDVLALAMAAMHCPRADAIAPVQCSRTRNHAMFSVLDAEGRRVESADRSFLAGEVVRVATAHFGLTLLRASALRAMPRPWFQGTPDPAGAWGDGRTDDDVHFWRQWERGGFSLYLAPRVAIGHAELMVRWPDGNLEPIHQHPSEYWQSGKPEGVWR